MTDNEIIKAIEGCIAVDVSCGNCPFDGYHDCDKRMREMFLDLINRQKAEVEGYKESNREYAEMLYEQTAEIKKKDTEIDILIRKNETLKDEVSELRVGIKRLADNLKYYLNTNEENGVVFIPVFVIEKGLRELTEKGR